MNRIGRANWNMVTDHIYGPLLATTMRAPGSTYERARVQVDDRVRYSEWLAESEVETRSETPALAELIAWMRSRRGGRS